jgi:hypothetical protein
MSPHWLVRLYPPVWRERYGEEFLVLLEARPPRHSDLIDIAWGALDAHLFPQAPAGRFRMFTRIAGVAAMAAGVALLGGFLGFIVPGINEYTVLAFYVLALIGLVGIHVRHFAVSPALAWLAFAVPFLSLFWGIAFVVLTRIGVLPTSGGELGYWAAISLWIGAAALGAAILTFRVLPVVVGLAFVMSAPLALLDLVASNSGVSSDTLAIVSQVGIVLFALGWLGAGWSLVAAQTEEGLLGPANS